MYLPPPTHLLSYLSNVFVLFALKLQRINPINQYDKIPPETFLQ